MRLDELRMLEHKYPKLGILLSKLESYLFELSVIKSNPDIVPVLLAKKLSIDEGLALTILMLSDEAGLLEPGYQVYCAKTDSYLEEFPRLKDIPSNIFCSYDNEYHDSQNYEVELVFHFTRLFQDKYLKVAA